MISIVLALFSRTARGPYGIAVIVSSLVVGALSLGTVYFKVHTVLLTRKVEARATAVCEEKERADRLEKENLAIREAKAQAEQSLAYRNQALDESQVRISTLENELREARDALAQSDDSARVVFLANDPWLRKGAAKAPPVPRRGGGPDPLQPNRPPRQK